MTFTDREVLEVIAGAIGLLFILFGWAYLDNRAHRQRNDDAHHGIREKIHHIYEKLLELCK